MSQTLNIEHRPATAALTLFAPIESELSEVECILKKELRSDVPFVDELLQYGCLLGGKRLRPALVLLTGKAAGAISREHLDIAAVVEMIHTATLVHDDVLDEAGMRRHLPTVNSRWDNQASVLLGDYLFTHAFYLASKLDSTFACRTIGRATNTVCEGEMRQIGTRGDMSLDEGQYMAIIEAKTAALCACCCRLGAHFAEAAAGVVERMTRYGRGLGIAFQIADDLLDLLGDEKATGKSLGTDLAKRKPTLPLIHAFECATDPQRKQLMALIGAADGNGDTRHAEVLRWCERSGSLAYARNRAEKHAAMARKELDDMPESAEVVVLRRLTDFVVNRIH